MGSEKKYNLDRKLKVRHAGMIAIGGSIGTGLFLSSGLVLSKLGSVGALLIFILSSLLVYFLMESLRELTVFRPITGSFSTFLKDYVNGSLASGVGWMYVLNMITGLVVEILTASIILQFWFPDIPTWIFSSIIFVLIFLVNIFSVSNFGEVEYWMSLIKVVAIIIFLIVGVLLIFGLLGSPLIGLNNFLMQIPSINFINIIQCILIAVFAFSGIENLGIALGELNEVNKVSNAFNLTIFRIILFYIAAIFIMGAVIPYTQPNLLGASKVDVSMSPFTLVFAAGGFSFATSFMNFIVFAAILSAANAGVYVLIRMFYILSKEGFAPKILGKTNKKSILINSALLSFLLTGITYVLAFFNEKAYLILLNSASIATLLTWLGILLSQYRFRKAYIKQGYDLKKLKYAGKFFPYGTLFAMIFCIILIIFSFFIFDDIIDIIASFSTLIALIIVILYHKLKHKTKIIPLDEIDLRNEND
jgi:lysine-specific permease